MTVFHAVLVFVVVQRLTELVWSARNTRRLLARGAQEVGARHYPLFVLLHGSWLIALALTVPSDAQPHWPLLGVFVLLQLLRLWVVATLGPYWTTRIITLANAPLVRHGPFRWLKHPNYAVVVGEIAVLPLAFGAWQIALAGSLLNALLLWHRIRVEEAALQSRRDIVPARGS
jgi:methyltransferase